MSKITGIFVITVTRKFRKSAILMTSLLATSVHIFGHSLVYMDVAWTKIMKFDWNIRKCPKFLIIFDIFGNTENFEITKQFRYIRYLSKLANF